MGGDASIDDGNWHHIAFTTTSSAQVIYVDGSSAFTGTLAFGNVASSDNSLIGDDVVSNYEFQGQITDVAIWDTVLDANTVASIYNSGEPNDLTLAASYTAGSGTDKSGDLQGYWRMCNASDDSHPTIQDQTSNNNDGTMTNMSAFDIVDHAPNRNSGDMINFDATSDIETDTP